MAITVAVLRQTATVAIPSELVKVYIRVSLVTWKKIILLLAHKQCGGQCKNVEKMVIDLYKMKCLVMD